MLDALLCGVTYWAIGWALAYGENVFFLLQKLLTEAYTLTPSLLLHEAGCKSMK